MNNKIKKQKRIINLFFFIFFPLTFSYCQNQQKINVTVDCDDYQTNLKSVVGFLHYTNLSALKNNINELKPRYWRIGWNLRKEDVNSLIKQGITPILVISDKYGYPGEGRNWTNPLLSSNKLEILTESIYKQFGNSVIYDIWNEPDHPYFWKDSKNDFFRTFKIAYDKIRSLPGGRNALISGPSTTHFNTNYLIDFLTYCKNNNIHIDILSWHEMRVGKNDILKMGDDINWFRANYVNTKFKSVGIKKIQINEIIGDKVTYSPIAALTYFQELEKSNVDGSCKACWRNQQNGSDCNNNSMDGLLTDSSKPKSIWWIYKLYTESLNFRIKSNSSSKDLIAFTYLKKNKASKSINILVGNYSSSKERNLELDIKNINHLLKNKSKKITVEVSKIPDMGDEYLISPILISKKVIKLNNTQKIYFEKMDSNTAYLFKFSIN